MGASAQVASAVGLDTPFPLTVLLIGAPVCAIAGAQLGHYIGAKAGPRLFARPESRLFKQEYVEKAQHYFEVRPGEGRRAGAVHPDRADLPQPGRRHAGHEPRRFLIWNILGGVLWTDGLLLFGYFIGSRIPNVDRYILPGAAVIILLSVIPIIREVLKNRKAAAGVPPVGPGTEPKGKHHRETA